MAKATVKVIKNLPENLRLLRLELKMDLDKRRPRTVYSMPWITLSAP
jgi:hypothetical protein